jgi:DNA-directed RNA polymerase sigma subunit (sigma70/sigma32)
MPLAERVQHRLDRLADREQRVVSMRRGCEH